MIPRLYRRQERYHSLKSRLLSLYLKQGLVQAAAERNRKSKIAEEGYEIRTSSNLGFGNVSDQWFGGGMVVPWCHIGTTQIYSPVARG